MPAYRCCYSPSGGGDFATFLMVIELSQDGHAPPRDGNRPSEVSWTIGFLFPVRGRSFPRVWFSIEQVLSNHYIPPGDKIKSASARHRVMRSFSSLFQKSLPFCSFSKKSSRQRAMVSLPGHPPRVSYFFRLHQRVGPSCSSTNRQRRRTFCEGRFLRSVSAKTLSTSSR